MVFAFCFCSRPFCASSCTQVPEWVEKIISAAFVTCIVKGIVSWCTKHFGCANSQQCISHYPFRMCSSSVAMCMGSCCHAVPSSVFRILWPICYIFTLCGKLCSAAWSSCLQEKSFYFESNLSEWWQEKQWIQSITSLSPSFPFSPYGEWFIVCPESLCFSIKKLWIENWHWLFTILQGLDPLGFSSLLKLNTSAFKNLFWLLR